MSIVAIIPARGGSKRIPGKNIRPFAGKPIIAYSIEAARNAKLFDRILVSTDSENIAAVARQFGAEVPFMRPNNLADDFTGTGAVVWHGLDWLMRHHEPVQHVCCIYATAPFVTAESIRQGYETLLLNNAPSAFTVTTFPAPIYRAFKINRNDQLEMMWPEHYMSRSQDFTEAYMDAGQFYWAQAENFLKEKKFYVQGAVPVILPRHLVQDIDTEEDWLRAEFMYHATRDAQTVRSIDDP